MSKNSVYFMLGKISGKHDTKELKRELDTFPGVISVSVNAEKDTLAVDYDSTGITPERLSKQIEQLGYTIEAQNVEEHIM